MPPVSGAFEPPSNRTRRSGLKRALTTISRLYGNPSRSPDESADGRDVLSALILTILSQATTDGNRDVAYARFELDQQLRAELDATKLKLAERKTVERAKGLLMKAKGISEDEAYALLRKAAMDQGKRLAAVAEAIVTAANLLK